MGGTFPDCLPMWVGVVPWGLLSFLNGTFIVDSWGEVGLCFVSVHYFCSGSLEDIIRVVKGGLDFYNYLKTFID